MTGFARVGQTLVMPAAHHHSGDFADFQFLSRAPSIIGMSSNPQTVAFIVDQAGGAAGGVAARPMFGEVGLYLEGKLVALVCDDQLFVKPTSGGRAFAPDASEAAPYPGAKPCLLIDAERCDDGPWLKDLLRRTAAELPLPKPKNKRKPDPSAGNST